MARPKTADGIKSSMIIAEVQQRPCLFDMNHPNYGDRAAKNRCWDEVCSNVVPDWSSRGSAEKYSAGKEVQKRWRSIRDSYTKAFRQGKCFSPEQCPTGSRRYHYHRQMSFLLRALQNKKPRRHSSEDKIENMYPDMSSPSPRDQSMEELSNRENMETSDTPLDLKTNSERKVTIEKSIQADIIMEFEGARGQTSEKSSSGMKINNALPPDLFDEDKLFMDSILPLFKKMDDDTKLLCRIEMLKTIRYALQGHECSEALKMDIDKMSNGKCGKDTEMPKTTGKLSMTTRSADGSRRKRKSLSPLPLPQPLKKRGPGRPRKTPLPPSDSEDEISSLRIAKSKPKANSAVRTMSSELDEWISKATSVAQLSTPQFMKVYNLGHSKVDSTQKSKLVDDFPNTVSLVNMSDLCD